MEEMETIKAPYYMVKYSDDNGDTHLAIIDNIQYLHYVLDRFVILEVKYIKSNLDNK